MLQVKHPFKIVGTGTRFPDNEVTSEFIESRFGISEGWSVKNSGVAKRFHVKNETNADLGAGALREALANAGIGIEQIGMLISGSATFDCPLPNQSSMIKAEFKEATILSFPCVDINTTCLGFVTALDYASRIIDNDKFKYMAIVCSEIASKGIDVTNKETLTLFGDGAAAVILKFDETGNSGTIQYEMKTYSEGVNYTIIRGGGNKYFFKDYPYNEKLHSFAMEGLSLLKLAKRKIPEFMNDFFSGLPVGIVDIDHIIPHQASKMGLQIFYNLYDIEEKKRHGNLYEKGNCISASIPLILCEIIKNGKLKSGETVFLTGSAAGFSIGGLLLRY